MSLNKFLKTYRSEDDTSFNKIWESERLGFIAKNYNIFKEFGRSVNKNELKYNRPLPLTYELPPNIKIEDSKIKETVKAIENQNKYLEITNKSDDGKNLIREFKTETFQSIKRKKDLENYNNKIRNRKLAEKEIVNGVKRKYKEHHLALRECLDDVKKKYNQTALMKSDNNFLISHYMDADNGRDKTKLSNFNFKKRETIPSNTDFRRFYNGPTFKDSSDGSYFEMTNSMITDFNIGLNPNNFANKSLLKPVQGYFYISTVFFSFTPIKKIIKKKYKKSLTRILFFLV